MLSKKTLISSGMFVTGRVRKYLIVAYCRGDLMLKATCLRKATQSSPQDRAPSGKKIDYLVKSKALSWHPEVLIGEISGGLPRCANWKYWHDFMMRCALGSRDCLWRIAQEIPDVTSNDLEKSKMYSFQLAGKPAEDEKSRELASNLSTEARNYTFTV